MYLGVHTPLDVGVSVVIGIVLLFVLYPVFRDIDRHPNRFYGFLAVLAVLLAAFLLYSYLWSFPDWMYAEEHVVNLIEARHNASILTGALAALTIAYTLDLRRTRCTVLQPLQRLPESGSAGCCKEHDLLSVHIVTFQE